MPFLAGFLKIAFLTPGIFSLISHRGTPHSLIILNTFISPLTTSKYWKMLSTCIISEVQIWLHAIAATTHRSIALLMGQADRQRTWISLFSLQGIIKTYGKYKIFPPKFPDIVFPDNLYPHTPNSFSRYLQRASIIFTFVPAIFIPP